MPVPSLPLYHYYNYFYYLLIILWLAWFLWTCVATPLPPPPPPVPYFYERVTLVTHGSNYFKWQRLSCFYFPARGSHAWIDQGGGTGKSLAWNPSFVGKTAGDRLDRFRVILYHRPHLTRLLYFFCFLFLSRGFRTCLYIWIDQGDRGIPRLKSILLREDSRWSIRSISNYTLPPLQGAPRCEPPQKEREDSLWSIGPISSYTPTITHTWHLVAIFHR